MNFRRQIEITEGQFQIAPMIDVVFIMLVFFTAIAAMRQSERELEIKPPPAAVSSPIERNVNDIIINIREDGAIIINRAEKSLDELHERLRLLRTTGTDASVLIRADGRTMHRDVAAVIDACVSTGVKKFSFITVEPRHFAHDTQNQD